MRQGLAAYLAMGAETEWPYLLSLLAKTYEKAGQTEDGLRVLGEALTAAHKHELHLWEAEFYRLKGVLLLRWAVPDEQGAESAWRQSLDIARRQHAKSLEL